MIKRLLVVLIALLSFGANAQIVQPAKWSTKIVQKSPKEAELQFIVKLDPEWHIYSQKEIEDGPLPTVFAFEKNKILQPQRPGYRAGQRPSR